MTTYWLRSIYRNEKGEEYTSLGTYGNEIFRGKSLKRKLTNFKKLWMNAKNFSGDKIVGVEIETCTENKFSEGRKERIIWM